jgi:2-dehydropantoate 2-reductase
MKITVLGAGAMGSLYGGMLAEAGHEVWLLCKRETYVNAIRDKGLCIQEMDREKVIKHIQATISSSEIGETDLVIVLVKSGITREAVIKNKNLFGHHTIVLTLQNGLGNIEKMGQVVPKKNIIAGITAHGSTMLEPGKIRHAGEGETYIGEMDGQLSERIQKIAEVFRKAGIRTTVSNNILGLVWRKLLVNIGINALTAITGLKNGQLIQSSEMEELLEWTVKEGWEIANAKGIELDCDDPILYTKKVCKATADNQSSMLQDILNKKRTEIGMMNGAIVNEGKKLGIPTPINQTLTNLISTIEKNYAMDGSTKISSE